MVGNWSNLSAYSCKPCKPLSLWLMEDDENEVVEASESLNLSKCSWNCDTRGNANPESVEFLAYEDDDDDDKEEGTLLLCIIFDTKDQLIRFECAEPEIKFNKDSNMEKVVTSTSFNKLTEVTALKMAFLITFLEFKNILTSIMSSLSPPFLLLLIIDCSSRVHSFVCISASLVAEHVSRSLKDPSKSSSTHFSWL
ncbi:hypothetical protein Lal_00019404 [Lupinus albus]|nr:hypothetical protein Lal_00019404 [Lupinus albus]